MAEQVGGYEKLGSFYPGKEDDTEKSEINLPRGLGDSRTSLRSMSSRRGAEST